MVWFWIDEITEADESATSKQRALEALECQVQKRETMGVVAMYERAAWSAGATVAETEEILRRRPR